jgi:phosphoglycerate dehydrogenase-like enzyme
VVLTRETRNMLGARELALMKPGAMLVNTSRGGAIVEAALAAAIDSVTSLPRPGRVPARANQHG